MYQNQTETYTKPLPFKKLSNILLADDDDDDDDEEKNNDLSNAEWMVKNDTVNKTNNNT